MKLPDNIRKFVPKVQQSILSSSGEFSETIQRLEREISEIPSEYQSPSEEEAKKHGSYKNALIVYAHFFYAGCDWFILSWDRRSELVYCYAILNGDVEMSELGDTYLSYLVQDGRIELDFYWEKCSLDVALHDKHPNYFPKPIEVI